MPCTRRRQRESRFEPLRNWIVLGHKIAPLSYDIHDYAKLGLLHKLLHVEDPDKPSQATVAQVQKELIDAVADARAGSKDLSNRLTSKAARETRKAGLAARALHGRAVGEA